MRLKQAVAMALTGVLLASMVFIVVGCGGDVGGDDVVDRYGGEITYGHTHDIDSFNPVLAQSITEKAVQHAVFNGLVKTGPDMETVGDLAVDWEITDNGTTYSFQLKEGVSWHDGEPFTSADVKFSIETYKDPSYGSAASSDFAIIESISTPDEHTVVFVLSQAMSPFLSYLETPILPEHILGGMSPDELRTSEFSRDPVGTGPFFVEEWEKDERIVLTAFEDYFDGRPFLNKVIFKIVPDANVLFAQLQSGEIDMYVPSPRTFERIEESGQFATYESSTMEYYYIGYKLDNPPFDSPVVRRALTMAIDRQEIIDTIFLGHATAIESNLPPASWAANTTLEPVPYDPEGARELLESEGYTLVDGVYHKDGEPLSFKLITYKGDKAREEFLPAIQSYWKAVGIDASIEVQEWGGFITAVFGGDFESEILKWGWGSDPDVYKIWHSSQTAGYNYMHYNNPQVDQLLTDARAITDIDGRKELYYEMQEIVQDDQPYTFLLSQNVLLAARKDLKGIQMNPMMSILSTWNIENWYIGE